jgi:uncharacterized protein (DUF427 family)
VNDYPATIHPETKVAPVPRRIRAVLAGEVVVDTVRASYVWEVPYYPQYYVPLQDVRRDLLVAENHRQQGPFGTVDIYGLRVGETDRPRAAKVVTASAHEVLRETVRFDWAALDAWFEEDEEVFVHPRNPYVRVDAVRSTRHVRVELDGVVLADSSSPVLVFETGLPTRYYLNRTEIRFERLIRTDTTTRCPYKGTTTGYWSVHTSEATYPDLAWSYDFPTRELTPIAGLVAFYNEKVDLSIDGRRLDRPQTHFSRSGR